MMKQNNYIFFGSPEFAAEVLKKLIELDHAPKLVITNPDRPQGKDAELSPPPAKSIAEVNKIPVYQPESLDLAELRTKISKAEFGLIAAYSQILKRDILDAFPGGILGLHPSLLPKYRGASPIQSALLAGEKETGISLYLMDEKMDHGPILAQEKIAIEDSDDYFSLEEKLAGAGAKLFTQNISRHLNGEIPLVPQDESLATLTKKLRTEDAFIRPEEVLGAKNGNPELSLKVFNAIRALAKEPGAWTYGSALPELNIGGEKRVKLLKAKLENGGLKITRIQVEGKLQREI